MKIQKGLPVMLILLIKKLHISFTITKWTIRLLLLTCKMSTKHSNLSEFIFLVITRYNFQQNRSIKYPPSVFKILLWLTLISCCLVHLLFLLLLDVVFSTYFSNDFQIYLFLLIKQMVSYISYLSLFKSSFDRIQSLRFH